MSRYELNSKGELLKQFGIREEKGLLTKDVEGIRKEHGWNELEKEDGTPLWKLVAEQFDDTLVQILLAAAVVSFVLALLEEGGENEGIAAFIEPIVILVILVLNAMVGVWQESNAEAALDALKDLQPDNARVLRDGSLATLPARELLPGDIVEIRTGDKVPADLRLISMKTTSLRVEQAQLTGESVSVMKDIDALSADTENVIQAKTNMMFATTVVVNGMGMGMVVEIGMSTEIGNIQKSVQEAAEEEEATPLKKKLDEFGDLLSKVILVICVVVWAINYKNFFDPLHGSVVKGCIYYFKIAVALAVAAIPEGLPAVITTCLALGTRKMAKKNAIVRKLPSVETLGCTNVICSDKTGTLTANQMTAITFCHSNCNRTKVTIYDVKGNTYAPEGKIEGMQPLSGNTTQLNMIAAIMSLCNTSTIEYDEDKSQYIRVGEPTEAALKVLVEKMGHPDPEKHDTIVKSRTTDPKGTVQACNDHWASVYPTVATLEFSRDRKSMSVLCSSGKDGNKLLVKGAPESLIERCSEIMHADGKITPLTSAGRTKVLTEVQKKSSQALRCIGLAYKNATGDLATFDGDRNHPGHKILQSNDSFAQIESGLVFVGFVGMLDPPRPEIKPVLKVCDTAGIRVIMITGDNKLTAEAICSQVGIFGNAKSFEGISYTGGEFFSLPESEQKAVLAKDKQQGLCFSRTEPKHKQQLVRLLKAQGDIVAMTGDGVNDAPALKQADIGIAMGITGTEVAKEASDMVLADDNFATIVSAIDEGRSIYDNMQAFIRYLISSNIGEVAAIFFTAALGLPEGLIPVQLLLVNLVTDGPPATALGFNPSDANIMKKLPRGSDEDLITPWTFFRMMVVGIYVGVACVWVFAHWYIYYDESGDGHTLVTFEQLTHWNQCPTWENFSVNNFDGMDFSDDPCKYFTEGKVKASTLSLTVLVTIEMFNALNALSEDGSIFSKPPWVNPWLLFAMGTSFAAHFLVLYVPMMADIFFVSPLDWNEWMLVLKFSAPVILIDEVLKFVSRYYAGKELVARMSKLKKD